MPSIPERVELFRTTCAERGLDPDKVIAEIMAKNHCSLPIEAISIGLEQMAVTDTAQDDVEGIYVGSSTTGAPGSSNQRSHILVATKDGILALTVSPIPSIPRYSRVKVGGVVRSDNKQTGSHWYTVKSNDQITVGALATPGDITGLLTYPHGIKGSGQWWFARGEIGFVNKRPAEKFNPNAPKTKFAAGKKSPIATRPVYDPASQSFALAMDVNHGQETVRVNLYSEEALQGLYTPESLGDKGFGGVLEWIRNPAVSDDSKHATLQSYFRGLPVVVFARGGNEIAGRAGAAAQTLPKPSLSVTDDGFIMLEDRFWAEVGGAPENGHAASATAIPAAPPPGASGIASPAAVTGPILPPSNGSTDELATIETDVVKYIAEKGTVQHKDLAAMSKTLGYGTKMREVSAALASARQSGRLVRDGQTWKAVATPAELGEPAPDPFAEA